MKDHINEMRQINNETITKVETVRELNSNLNVAMREVQELQISLNKSKNAFDVEAERIKQLGNYVGFLALKVSRSETFRTFENDINLSKKLISKPEYWLKDTLPKVTEVLGNNVSKEAPDETIEEKLRHYIETLKENECSFWE